MVRRRTVLLVDDQLDLLVALKEELSEVAEVSTASSVAEALGLVAERRFDIVVTDLRLPERWGDELLAHLAARQPATRRLLLTGDDRPQDTVRELVESGVVEAYFTKPGVTALVEKIRSLLR